MSSSNQSFDFWDSTPPNISNTSQTSSASTNPNNFFDSFDTSFSSNQTSANQTITSNDFNQSPNKNESEKSDLFSPFDNSEDKSKNSLDFPNFSTNNQNTSNEFLFPSFENSSFESKTENGNLTDGFSFGEIEPDSSKNHSISSQSKNDNLFDFDFPSIPSEVKASSPFGGLETTEINDNQAPTESSKDDPIHHDFLSSINDKDFANSSLNDTSKNDFWTIHDNNETTTLNDDLFPPSNDEQFSNLAKSENQSNISPQTADLPQSNRQIESGFAQMDQYDLNDNNEDSNENNDDLNDIENDEKLDNLQFTSFFDFEKKEDLDEKPPEQPEASRIPAAFGGVSNRSMNTDEDSKPLLFSPTNEIDQKQSFHAESEILIDAQKTSELSFPMFGGTSADSIPRFHNEKETETPKITDGIPFSSDDLESSSLINKLNNSPQSPPPSEQSNQSIHENALFESTNTTKELDFNEQIKSTENANQFSLVGQNEEQNAGLFTTEEFDSSKDNKSNDVLSEHLNLIDKSTDNEFKSFDNSQNDFGNFPSFDNQETTTKENGFGGFPSFENKETTSFEKANSRNEFGFASFDNQESATSTNETIESNKSQNDFGNFSSFDIQETTSSEQTNSNTINSQNEFGFPSFETTTKEEGFEEFPSFDDQENQTSSNDLPSFKLTDTDKSINSSQNEFGFPSFEANNSETKTKENGFGDFPSFETNDKESPTKETGFGEFLSFENKDTTTLEQNNSQNEFGFPSFESAETTETSFDKPKTSTENGFGEFPSFDIQETTSSEQTNSNTINSQNEFGFPSFESAETSSANKSLFDNNDSQQNEFGFSSFETNNQTTTAKEDGFCAFPSFENADSNTSTSNTENSNFGSPSFKSTENNLNQDNAFSVTLLDDFEISTSSQTTKTSIDNLVNSNDALFGKETKQSLEIPTFSSFDKESSVLSSSEPNNQKATTKREGFGEFPSFNNQETTSSEQTNSNTINSQNEFGFSSFETTDYSSANKSTFDNIDSQHKNSQNEFEFPLFETNENESTTKENEFGFPSFETTDTKSITKENGFGEFPLFDNQETTSSEQTNSKTINSQNEFQFHSFETTNQETTTKEEGFGEFPSFQTNDKEQTNLFNSSTNDNEKSIPNDFDFPAFNSSPQTTADENKIEFSSFEIVDSDTKETTVDTNLGTVDNENSSELPTFNLSSSAENKSNENEEIGKFSDFPSFGNENKSSESPIDRIDFKQNEFFNDIDHFENRLDSKPNENDVQENNWNTDLPTFDAFPDTGVQETQLNSDLPTFDESPNSNEKAAQDIQINSDLPTFGEFPTMEENSEQKVNSEFPAFDNADFSFPAFDSPNADFSFPAFDANTSLPSKTDNVLESKQESEKPKSLFSPHFGDISFEPPKPKVDTSFDGLLKAIDNIQFNKKDNLNSFNVFNEIDKDDSYESAMKLLSSELNL